MEKKHIAVLMGGPSPEFDISLKSGEEILSRLSRERYEPIGVFIDRKGKWDISPKELRDNFDCAFIALHGSYGEDGTIQSILEENNIPYTGAGVLASALAMNKFLTLQILADINIKIPITLHIPKREWDYESNFVITTILQRIGLPIVIKPNYGGSSIGTTIVKTKEKLKDALHEAFSFSRDVLAQEYIKGREFTCGVIDRGWPSSAFSLLPTEIIPRKGEFFDYFAKYEKEGSFEITPPQGLSNSNIKKIRDIALQTHKKIGAVGCSRTDIIMDSKGDFFVLEINTIPGFTKESLIPKAAEISHISFEKLCDIMIEAAFRYHAERRNKKEKV